MADTRCASSVFIAATRREMQKPLKLLSISSSSVKPLKRRNHLRIKILETLTKPYPSSTLPLPVEPQSSAEFSIVSPETQIETPSGDSSTGEFAEAVELQVSDTFSVGEHGGGGAGLISTRSVLNVCLCLIGAIVIHIFHGVWFLRKTVSNSEKEDGHLEKLEQEVWETEKSLIHGNELKEKIEIIANRVGSSVSKLEGEIEEIRRMAREVRRGEGRHLGSNVENNRSEIEKQIGLGLARVQTKMDYPPIEFQKSLKVDDGKTPNDVDLEELNKKVIFKNKGLKAKRPSMEPGSEPKGFEGLENDDTYKENSELGVIDASVGSVCNDGVGLLDGEKQVNLQDGELLPSVSRSSDLNDVKNLKSESNSVGRTKFGSNESRTVKHGAPKQVDGRKKGIASEVKDKQLCIKTDLWWLNLPNVLMISMRRGPEGEGPKKVFSLKVASQEVQEHSDSSYTVAFENYGDANNLCLILESFLEDLDDFTAGIVTVSTKELHGAVKLNEMKVVVVRKGELKLYAGRLLADVERDLHSLIERNQNTNIPN